MNLYDLDAERNILSCVFLENDVIIEGNRVNLCADDFFYTQHSIIYTYMKKLYDTNIGIDPVTLRAELEKNDMLEKAGGISYLAGLTALISVSEQCIVSHENCQGLQTKRSIKDLLSNTIKRHQKAR